MRTPRIVLQFGVALLFGAAATGQAEIIICEQHPASYIPNPSQRSNLPGPEFQQQIADDFVPSQDNQATAVSWTGFYNADIALNPNAQVLFTIRLYAGDSPTDAPLFSSLLPAAPTLAGDISQAQVYRFRSVLPYSIPMSAGQQYWLAILESDPSTNQDFRWLASQNEYSRRYAYRYGEGAPWFGVNDRRWDFAFTIEGVPESSTAALLGIGVCLSSVGWRYR